MTNISKVLEIENCKKEDLIKALYEPEFWKAITPVQKIEAKFIAPNVLYNKIYDQVSLIKVPIELESELVLSDKGEEAGKGRLIEINIRNNNEIKNMEARLRIKDLTSSKSKVGIFIDELSFSNDFLSLLGGAADMILQTKITEMMRNLQKLCKVKDLRSFFAS
jgi:hypothetical protein